MLNRCGSMNGNINFEAVFLVGRRCERIVYERHTLKLHENYWRRMDLGILNRIQVKRMTHQEPYSSEEYDTSGTVFK
ncbi:hypothetical protein TNCV_4746231 [Trichonephila clavipes]|nr:hypothetical protein TNCV_4746231 [Trichonephila clavipes]